MTKCFFSIFGSLKNEEQEFYYSLGLIPAVASYGRGNCNNKIRAHACFVAYVALNTLFERVKVLLENMPQPFAID